MAEEEKKPSLEEILDELHDALEKSLQDLEDEEEEEPSECEEPEEPEEPEHSDGLSFIEAVRIVFNQMNEGTIAYMTRGEEFPKITLLQELNSQDIHLVTLDRFKATAYTPTIADYLQKDWEVWY